MKIKVLASGSKGNSTLVMTDNVRFLIDAGITFQKISMELDKIGLTPNDLTGVLISHIHSDHIKGLKILLKKTGLKAYIPKKMEKELLTIIDREYIEIIDECTKIIDMEIEMIPTSHDTEYSIGFIISDGEKTLVHITDTGYINKKNLNLMINKDIYVIESNHDEQMLMDGPYPYYLKQRVMSDSGHLSNKTTAKYLSTIVGDKTKNIILAHLSEKNNTKEIAYNETKNKLAKINYQGDILIADQYESTNLIEV